MWTALPQASSSSCRIGCTTSTRNSRVSTLQIPCCRPPRKMVRLVTAAESKDDSSEPLMDDEARLEALERGVKRKQGAKTVSAQMRRAQEKKDAFGSDRGMAEWREGELFPEGWEDMPVQQKVAELYTGKRGLLFWMGKITYALIFVLFAGWVVFRFVLPQFGLELQNGLDSPPNY